MNISQTLQGMQEQIGALMFLMGMNFLLLVALPLILNRKLNQIQERLTTMSAQITDLDTELGVVETDLVTLGSNLTTASAAQTQAIADLEAKIGTGQDATPELNRLKAIDASIAQYAAGITALGASAIAADPGAPVVPTPAS